MRNKCNCIPEPPYRGLPGLTPYIGKNGNWWIGATDTGVSAAGVPGTSATVAIGQTATLPAGSPATVANVGTPSAAVLNFGIPQGVQGVQGVPGVPGTPGGGSALEYSFLRGIVGNDAGTAQTVASGEAIKFKEVRGNSTAIITMGPLGAYFTINKAGTYICTMNLCASTVAAADNTVVCWGLYAKKANTMLTSASNFLTPFMQGIGSVCIFEVTDVTEQYNLINNSKIQIRVQGAVAAQVVHNTMQSSNNLAQTDGLGMSFVRLGNVASVTV